MPAPNPKRESIYRYLRETFAWKEDWDARLIDGVNRIVKYEEVYNQLKYLTDYEEELAINLQYMWLSYQPRQKKANCLYVDNSTFKRKSDRAINIIINRINHPELVQEWESDTSLPEGVFA